MTMDKKGSALRSEKEPLKKTYRGRIAPTPSGYLHEGHAQTFLKAYQRARDAEGTLVLRNEDLDPQRCKKAYAEAILKDLRRMGIRWQEGPDCGGPYGPYNQSERYPLYLNAWQKLKTQGCLYPCHKSRKAIQQAAVPSNPGIQRPPSEPIYPAAWRPPVGTGKEATAPQGVNWRFRVPDGEVISFIDLRCGPTTFTAGVDFGDFLIWRKDDVPSYELAVVVDDAHMFITEVVRGEDLLLSTARQYLLYRALGAPFPQFYHCPLVCDASGQRLSKRAQSPRVQVNQDQEGS